MIDLIRQNAILDTIKALSSASHLTEAETEERQHLLMCGVLIGLGSSECPPHWTMNIQSGRVDRLFRQQTLDKQFMADLSPEIDARPSNHPE